MNIYIGENIKRLRQGRQITQEQLSVSMGVSCAAVSKWERGETLPDISLLPLLAQFFGVSIDELMGYDAARIEEEIVLFWRSTAGCLGRGRRRSIPGCPRRPTGHTPTTTES